VSALDLTAHWAAPNVSACVVERGRVAATIGAVDRRFPLASITKPLVAWAFLVAIEEGTIGLDDPAGQAGCTIRHLLCHAGGYGFDDPDPISRPQRTRGYSNTGIEIAARKLEQASGMLIGEYLTEAVLAPLGMDRTSLGGSPAHGAVSCVSDLARLAAEMREPTLITPTTRDTAFHSTYPELSGIVPGVGRYAPCPWGLGFEIRGDKSPHWTGQRNSPRTVGHFGGAGTMFWFDPDADLALVALSDRRFSEWALAAWPQLSDAVITEYAPGGGPIESGASA
jgi:CubicO group peptidase (beta-lactamase class C family)